MSITIASNYPRSGTLNAKLAVPTRLTSGRATRIEIWLNDGGPRSVVTAEHGVEYGSLDVFVVPVQRGTWRLNARVEDACGNVNQTGAVRTVVVQ